MKKLFLLIAVAIFALSAKTAMAAFDEFGYNDTARVFNGLADGIDGKLDGKVWGDTTYANDKLVMKWNSEWDRGNAEGWTDPNGYDAWENNEWNGMGKNGSGAVWKYKIVWVGDYIANPDLIPDGAYGIWNQFITIMDQGKDPNYEPGHIWFTHAKPAGYGAY